MALTKIQIISNALTLLGKGPITTIAGAGDFGAAAEDLYDLLIKSVIAKNNWRFATKLAVLSQLVTTPIVDRWRYIYQLPVDYVALWRLYPATMDYQIFNTSHLYANEPALSAEYRYVPSESSWPYYFIDYFTTELAERLALAVAQSDKYAQEMRVLKLQALPGALNADAMSHPSEPAISNPFISVRG